MSHLELVAIVGALQSAIFSTDPRISDRLRLVLKSCSSVLLVLVMIGGFR